MSDETLKEKTITKNKIAAEDKLFGKTKQVVKKPPVLFKQTQDHLEQLSQIIGCPVLSYFKPPSGNIWSQDLYALMQGLKTIGKVDKLAVYLRSDGGSGMVSLRIIHLLRSFVKELILLAPSECASAATMLALGCDEIHMGPLSSLSPVDSSMVHQLSPMDKVGNKVSISFDELSRVVKLWNKEDTNNDKLLDILESNKTQNVYSNLDNPYKHLYNHIHPLVFGAVDRHSSLSARICREVLSYHITDQDTIQHITDKLNHDYPAHGYPITQKEAISIGLPIRSLSDQALQILNELQLLYGEMAEDQITDFDSISYHDNTVYSIIETVGMQIIYQHNYDKFYRENEKRYIILNDKSGWSKNVFDMTKSGKIVTSRVFI